MKENPDLPQEAMEWGTFLETESNEISALVKNALSPYPSNPKFWSVGTPALDLYCPSKQCNRTMAFDAMERAAVPKDGGSEAFLHYRCRHCQDYVQLIAVIVVPLEDDSTAFPLAKAYLVGVFPPRGPRIPARLVEMFGPDRELFLKGRRAEASGFGLGAYAYYRRVVENQRARLIDSIIRAAAKAGAAEVVPQLEAAKRQRQFSRSMELIREALPPQLYIDGHNPFTLLHGPLSNQLHAGTDAEALATAKAIRTVLAALVEKISEVNKQHAGLKSAVSQLLRTRSGSALSKEGGSAPES